MSEYNTEIPKLITKLTSKYAGLNANFQSNARARARDVMGNLEPDKIISPTDTVLYIGTGSGHTSQLLNELTQASVLTVDLDDLRTADTKNPPFVQADATHLPFQSESFNAVAFVDMLHHCVDQDSILAEAVRVLKDKGKLLVHEETVPPLSRPYKRAVVSRLIRIIDDVTNLQPPGANPYNYHSSEEWLDIITAKGLTHLSHHTQKWGPSDLLLNIFPKFKPEQPQGTTFQTTGFIFEKTKS